MENLHGALLHGSISIKVLLADPADSRSSVLETLSDAAASDPDDLPPRARLFLIVPRDCNVAAIKVRVEGPRLGAIAHQFHPISPGPCPERAGGLRGDGVLQERPRGQQGRALRQVPLCKQCAAGARGHGQPPLQRVLWVVWARGLCPAPDTRPDSTCHPSGGRLSRARAPRGPQAAGAPALSWRWRRQEQRRSERLPPLAQRQGAATAAAILHRCAPVARDACMRQSTRPERVRAAQVRSHLLRAMCARLTTGMRTSLASTQGSCRDRLPWCQAARACRCTSTTPAQPRTLLRRCRRSFCARSRPQTSHGSSCPLASC